MILLCLDDALSLEAPRRFERVIKEEGFVKFLFTLLGLKIFLPYIFLKK